MNGKIIGFFLSLVCFNSGRSGGYFEENLSRLNKAHSRDVYRISRPGLHSRCPFEGG